MKDNEKLSEAKPLLIMRLSSNPNSVVVSHNFMKGTIICIGPGKSKLALFIIKTIQSFIKVDRASENLIASIEEALKQEIFSSSQ